MAVILYGWDGGKKNTGESPISTHTSLPVSEDSGPSGVTNRRTASVVFIVDCRSGHAYLHRQLLGLCGWRTRGLPGIP